MNGPLSDLPRSLADPDAVVALATVAERPTLRPSPGGEAGDLSLALTAIVAPSSAAAPPERLVVPIERRADPLERDRDGSNPWNAVSTEPGAALLVALRDGEVVTARAVGGADDPLVTSARAACALARAPLDDLDPARVRALAGADALPREALLARLGRARADLRVAHLVAALPLATDEVARLRLREALVASFDPEGWASRDNAAALTALTRALLAAPRAERLTWTRELARCLRYPFDAAPERQERVARALVLLVDAPPVEVVAALEGLAGQGTPDDQAAARDVLSLWLQL